MTDVIKTLNALESLVCRLPGVVVESTDVLISHIHLVMRIEQLESLAAIVYCSDASNLPLHVWSTAPSNPIEERSNPAYLRFRILAKDSDEGTVTALEGIQLFGIFLVWHFFDIGAMQVKEANQLLREWNGKLVSA